MQRHSLRGRYYKAMLLILIPVIVFSIFVYAMNQQTCRTIAEQDMTSRCKRTVDTFGDLFEQCRTMALNNGMLSHVFQYYTRQIQNGNSSVLCTVLANMETQLQNRVRIYCYFRGDTNIYSAQHAMAYRDFEIMLDYELADAAFFTSVLSIQNTQTKFLSLRSKNNSASRGIAFIAPVQITDTPQQALLVFILDDADVQELITLGMGRLPLNVHICAGKELLYSRAEPGAPDLQEMRLDVPSGLYSLGENAVILREYFSSLGLSMSIGMTRSTLYQSTSQQQNTLKMLIAVFLMLCMGVVVLIVFSHYRPIRELADEIIKEDGLHGDELERIRSGYLQLQSERNLLAVRVDEQKRLVIEQFCQRLLGERGVSREEYDFLAHCAGFKADQSCYAALCIMYDLLPGDTERSDRIINYLENHDFAPCSVAYCETMQENGICLLVNDDGEHLAEMAQQLFDRLRALMDGIRMGVGESFHDPMQLRESYLEALIAAGYGQENTLTVYAHNMEESKLGIYTFPMEKNLLLQAVQLGDGALASRTFQKILDEKMSDSVLVRQFQWQDLISSVAAQANDLGVSPETIHRFAMVSQLDGKNSGCHMNDHLEQICEETYQLLQRKDIQLRQRLVGFIEEHCLEEDFSLNTVLENLQITRTRVNDILKTTLGMSFIQYVSYLRMKTFKQRLIESDSKVQELVLEVGYQDVSSFLRKFKSSEGMTALEYRNLYRSRENRPV